MRNTIALAFLAFAGVAYASARRSTANGPADGINWGTLPADVFDLAQGTMNTITETPATTEPDTAAANVTAFLAAIRAAEGTDRAADPYRVVMGYGHTAGLVRPSVFHRGMEGRTLRGWSMVNRSRGLPVPARHLGRLARAPAAAGLRAREPRRGGRGADPPARSPGRCEGWPVP